MTGLYTDPDTGQLISTNSMLKTFRRCPRQADYKYHRRLKPKVQTRPLSFGTWMHHLLEAYYKEQGGFETDPWEVVHKRLTGKFLKLFDEEKDALGNLPLECNNLMKSYLWHYKEHEWKVLDVEGMLETEFPDGSIFRGKFDVLVEDEYGIWIVDHKNMKGFPNFDLRMLDTQSGRYVWAARKEGIPVQGFIWNYLKSKPITPPTMIQSGARLSLPSMKNCDYPTAARALKKYRDEDGLKIGQYKEWLNGLKSQRYEYGKVQSSEFFRRDVLERDQDTLDRIALETYHTSMRMHDYDFEERDTVERVVDRSCAWMCSYTKLCIAELNGGPTDLILRKDYKEIDPMEYYYDEKQTEEGIND